MLKKANRDHELLALNFHIALELLCMLMACVYIFILCMCESYVLSV